MKKRTIIVSILFLVNFFGLINANASNVNPLYVPLSVTLDTQKNNYSHNEVVRWEVKASSGTANYEVSPSFDVYFSDDRGNDYSYHTNKFTSSLSLDYQNSGLVKACVTVYGFGDSATDCHTISIEKDTWG